MSELFGPIIGITLVLMSVFIPAAFLPGLTGQMYAQFALVIAATAMISAVNAATLKPTQCAMWLRRPVPPEQRNWFYRGFNRVYDKLENAYASLIGRMARHSLLMVIIALAVAVGSGWGIARLPTAFIPTEDQGYVIIGVQLPDAASLERTQAALDEVGQIALKTPGVENAIQISGISVLDNSAPLANAGAVYVILKDWSVRGKAQGEDLRSIYANLSRELDKLPDAVGFVLVPPPIQGIGNASGFTMQVESRDGNFDYDELATRHANHHRRRQARNPRLHRLNTSFRADVPQIEVVVDRVKAETLRVPVSDVFAALSGYVGSTYVNQINKFGLTFQVYVQADSQYRLRPADIEKLSVRSEDGKMVPLGALAQVKTDVGPALISLYNLYPSATIVGGAGDGFSSGEALSVMEQIADKTLPPGFGYEWTAMSYQEKIVGGQIFFVFGAGHAAGLSVPGRAVRKLDRAAERDPGRAAGAARPGADAERARAWPTTCIPRSAWCC